MGNSNKNSKFIGFYTRNKGKIILISVLVLSVLFAMPFITKHRAKIGATYTEKEDVALYIMQHHELPSNYITHYGYTHYGRKYYKNNNIETTGFRIGGDTHYYDSALSSFGVGSVQSLKECDIYVEGYSLTNRGKSRLVYTCNTDKARVFYTTDHYGTFTELTYFSLQLPSCVFWIIFGVYSVSFVCFYLTVSILNKKSKNKEPLLLEKPE